MLLGDHGDHGDRVILSEYKEQPSRGGLTSAHNVYADLESDIWSS